MIKNSRLQIYYPLVLTITSIVAIMSFIFHYLTGDNPASFLCMVSATVFFCLLIELNDEVQLEKGRNKWQDTSRNITKEDKK